ncbi:lectin C-type domain protein [Oesophagostomum dentatum]|uniref:Lectin C-type domain protein n=1 Tax=Oesophagostomum dentatum TaxID=61180 RepID=A0A0B1TBA1_OESDE|nr:lectin C-type domain protein [Oesophagostomum dentatum]
MTSYQVGFAVRVAEFLAPACFNAKTALTTTSATDFWIGASDLVTAGKWTWTDNTNFLYTNWASGQPQSGNDCASSRLSDGNWLANGCLTQKPYACEVPPQLASTCPPPPTCPTPTTPKPSVCTQQKCTPHCESEWTYFVQANSCYKVFFGQKWADAEAFCVEQGAHLASVHSAQENTFIASRYPGALRSSWSWTDKTNTDYLNWADKQPDNPGKENCVEIAQDESDHGWYENWNNEECDTVMRAFVCKKGSIV